MANLFGLSQNDNMDASQISLRGQPIDNVYINENQADASLVN